MGALYVTAQIKEPSVHMQVVWTGGDKSTSLWCAYSGAFLGTIDRGREVGLPESSSFTRDAQSRALADDWTTKINTCKVQQPFNLNMNWYMNSHAVNMMQYS